METLFQDDYINNKVLKRLIKEVKKEQISRTIRNLDYYSALRAQLNKKIDFTSSQNQKLEALRQYQYTKDVLQA